PERLEHDQRRQAEQRHGDARIDEWQHAPRLVEADEPGPRLQDGRPDGDREDEAHRRPREPARPPLAPEPDRDRDQRERGEELVRRAEEGPEGHVRRRLPVPWRRSQTVIAISVSAARSWFDVPKRVQKAMYVGGFPGAGGSAASTNSSGRPTVASVGVAALVRPRQSNSSWMM